MMEPDERELPSFYQAQVDGMREHVTLEALLDEPQIVKLPGEQLKGFMLGVQFMLNMMQMGANQMLPQGD